MPYHVSAISERSEQCNGGKYAFKVENVDRHYRNTLVRFAYRTREEADSARAAVVEAVRSASSIVNLPGQGSALGPPRA